MAWYNRELTGYFYTACRAKVGLIKHITIVYSWYIVYMYMFCIHVYKYK